MATLVGTNVACVIDGGGPVACDLNIDQDFIDITASTERDPDWTFVDVAGHFHAYDTKGELPTLDRHEKFVACGCDYCLDGGEVSDDEDAHPGYSTSEYRCAICSEIVTPGTRAGRSRSVPGRREMTLTVPVDVWPDQVSVRIEIEGQVRYFGVAQVISSSAEVDANGPRTTTRLAVTRVGERS